MSVNLNGDLSQWTLGTEFLACASGQMLADGYRLHDVGAAVHTVRQSSDVPPLTVCGRVIPYSLEVEVTTADASIGATDVTAITYRGEGSEWAELAEFATEQRIYVKTNVPGTYHLTLSNGPETLFCSQPFTIAFADLWTPVTIPAPPSVGVTGTDWWTDHRVGYTVAVTLCAGSGVQGALGTWESGVKFGGAQQINFNANVGNKINIAGLRVRRADDDRPDFYQPPEMIARDCLRYLETSFSPGTAPASAFGIGTGELSFYAPRNGANTQGSAANRFRAVKRKTPAMTGYNPIGAGSQMRDYTAAQDCTNTTFDNLTAHGFRAFATGHANTVIGNLMLLHWLADATLPALGVSVGS
jgi:hypothetical protein